MYFIIKDIFKNPDLVGRYFISGAIGALSNLGTIYVLTDVLGLFYILSAASSFFVGFLVAFLLQKYWTFADFNNNKFTLQAMAFFIISVINLAINLSILFIFVEYIGLWYFYSQIIALAAVSIFSFLMNRHITFNHKIL